MNTKLQFRVLYRQFLFRLMDAELLAASARGDASQLFGQFAALLVFLSVGSLWGAGMYAGTVRTPAEALAGAWSQEHSMLTMTMLVVGIFAVFSWDSTFPDRRDVLVLAPLPVRGRTLFTAKIAAVATALGLTVLVLNGLSAFAWALALAPDGVGILGNLRFIAAFWVALPSAGIFLYCAILGVQGVVAQLSRRWYLRASSFLQIGAFGLILGVFLLEPSFTTAKALGAAENQRVLAWLPSYWFLGLVNALSGAYPDSAMTSLARRAVAGLAIAIFFAGGAYLLSYFRTLRKIVEEPDILPGAHGGMWLPRFGSSPKTALAQFAIRTLGRSRQHRMNLAFYVGVGFALVTLIITPVEDAKRLAGIDVLRQAMNVPMLLASLMVLCLCVLGTRVSFSRPLDLRANWLFRMMPMRGGEVCLSATRRALLALSVFPVCVGCAVLFLRYWPWVAVAKHLLLFGLFGGLLVELLLIGFRKIPYTCSYLPGKSKIHVMVLASVALLPLALINCVEFERWVTADWLLYGAAAAMLAGAGFAVRRYTSRDLELSGEIQFEEFAADELIGLGLE